MKFLKILLVLLAAVLAACSQEPEKTASAGTFFPIRLGSETVSVRLALTDLERSRGLMHCKGLNENEGMIFVYSTQEARSFWMANVPVNLSIGFFDATGRLLETREMRAQDLTSVFSASNRVQYCLEMREGWFREKNILPGAQLDLTALKTAIRAQNISDK